MIVLRELQTFTKELILFIFPPTCPGCGRVDTILCNPCSQKITTNPKSIGNSIIALMNYRDSVVKKALWLLKYNNRKSVAELFGKMLSDTILETLAENSALDGMHKTIIVPIPMSEKRLRMRGYNHTIYLCESLAKYLPGIRVEKNALEKTRETKRQALVLKRSKRFMNMQNSLKADPLLVSGKKIILIDDIVTTGATIKEATRALKSSGAYDVVTYVIAH